MPPAATRTTSRPSSPGVKTYVMLTGIVFGLITVAHVLRAIQEGPGVLNVWWVLLTVATAALSVWAFRLVRPSKIS